MLAHRGEEWGCVGPLLRLGEATRRLLPLGRSTWRDEARAVARIDDPEAFLEALVSAGLKTSMSPDVRCGCRSIPATGFCGSP